VFQITILFLYSLAAISFALSRLPAWSQQSNRLVPAAFLLAVTAICIDTWLLYVALDAGRNVSLSNAVALIGWQIAVIGVAGALRPSLRGVAAGLLALAALFALLTRKSAIPDVAPELGWQIRTHVLTSLFAYGLLTVGAILAVFALVQEGRLKSRKLSGPNSLFAPLETTEALLFWVTTAGFTVLALSVISGFTFIEDLFAQHLVHKTVLSLLALALFGVLILGRRFGGWRGRRAIYLYLAGFVLLCLAYFGSRYILEEILGRSWS
jgi:ABC-type uncharacterized transport system permease subunit